MKGKHHILSNIFLVSVLLAVFLNSNISLAKLELINHCAHSVIQIWRSKRKVFHWVLIIKFSLVISTICQNNIKKIQQVPRSPPSAHFVLNGKGKAFYSFEKNLQLHLIILNEKPENIHTCLWNWIIFVTEQSPKFFRLRWNTES